MTVITKRCIYCGEYYGTLVQTGKGQWKHKGECPHVAQALAKAKAEAKNEGGLL